MRSVETPLYLKLVTENPLSNFEALLKIDLLIVREDYVLEHNKVPLQNIVLFVMYENLPIASYSTGFGFPIVH